MQRCTEDEGAEQAAPVSIAARFLASSGKEVGSVPAVAAQRPRDSAASELEQLTGAASAPPR